MRRALPRLSHEQADRFRQRLVRDGDCLLWQGATNNRGYGVLGIDGRLMLVHRLAYYLATSVDPLQWDVLHACDTPCCCEPSHLFLGTQADNMADASRKGRLHKTGPSGESHYNAKLTTDNVRAIRARYAAGGISQPALAREYGTSLSNVWAIIHNRSWRNT